MAQAMIDFQKVCQFQSQSRLEQKQEKDMETLLSTFTEEIESQQGQNFSQDENDVQKKKKKRTAKSNYSNAKVKARHLLTNVSYKRFKQKDFNNASFIIDISLFIVQYFTPINLNRKLDIEKENLMVKFIWDECILNDFTRYICKNENHAVISNTKLTYQKANAIVKNFIEEDVNRINQNFPQSNFNAIHYVFLLLFPKIYNRTNNSGVQKESNFSTWKTRKQNNSRPIAPKIINELPAPTKQVLVTDMLSNAKNPKDYQNREVNEFEQTPLYFKKSVLDHTSALIAPAHKYRMTTETVEIKKKIGN